MKHPILLFAICALLSSCKQDENTGVNCQESNLVTNKKTSEVPQQSFVWVDGYKIPELKKLLFQLGLINKIVAEYEAIDRVLLDVSPENLKNLPTIKFEPLTSISIGQNCAGQPVDSGTQQRPWGISRVNGGVNNNDRAWIVDTGIDLDHPDLNVNQELSEDFVGSSGILGGLPIGLFADDGHGHGTHVAGTVGAINNDFGVIGVAAGCDLVAIRVLGDNGSGNTGDLMNALEYVSLNGSAGDVVNLSLGGPPSATVEQMIRNMSSAGFLFAIAAGNDSENASGTSPARVNGGNIYTVSASDQGDFFASFSNFGNPPVDFAGPGVNVFSTLPDGKYGTLSGTSMAAPHVAGVLMLSNGNPSSNGTVRSDPDGNPDPIIFFNAAS